MPTPSTLRGSPTRAKLTAFPEPVRRYLRFMGALERPPERSFRLHTHGRFRLRPDQAWMRCETWQYNSAVEIERRFRIQMRMWRVVPVVAYDTYVHGHGRMRARLLDRVTVQDVSGVELDVGELVTYLNDAILIAPSMLLGPQTRWTAVGDDRFDVALTDEGLTVTARVIVDDRGAPVDFVTTDRYVVDPDDRKAAPRRCRWSTPIEGWSRGGRPLPTIGRAVWHLPDGPFCYAELRIADGDLAIDVERGAA